MDNEHYQAARRAIAGREARYMGTPGPVSEVLAMAQIRALLAIADALDSIDDALRNTVGGVSR